MIVELAAAVAAAVRNNGNSSSKQVVQVKVSKRTFKKDGEHPQPQTWIPELKPREPNTP